MQKSVSIPYTTNRAVMDVITCDGCHKVIDMNLDVNDRRNRYTSDQVKVIWPYFDLSHYDRALEEVEHIHLCADCMRAKLDEWCKPESVDDEIEYDLEAHAGAVVYEEVVAMAVEEAKTEAHKAAAKERHEAEKEAAIDQSVRDEEEMLRKVFGDPEKT